MFIKWMGQYVIFAQLSNIILIISYFATGSLIYQYFTIVYIFTFDSSSWNVSDNVVLYLC